MKYRAYFIHSDGVESQTKLKGKLLLDSMKRYDLKCYKYNLLCHLLKMVWINKILDSLRITPWKTLFIDQYNKYGAMKYEC